MMPRLETDAVVAHLGHYEAALILRALDELGEREPETHVPTRLYPLFGGYGLTSVIYTPDEV